MDQERTIKKETTTTTTTKTIFQVEDNDANAYNTQYGTNFGQAAGPVYQQPYPVSMDPLPGPSKYKNGSQVSVMRPKTAREKKKERDNDREDSDEETFLTLTKYLCSTSSSHGVSRAAESKNIIRSVAWSLLFLGSLSAFCLQASYLLTDYMAMPIDVKTEIITKKNVVFPAITICNMNQMRRSSLENSSYATLTALDKTASELAAENVLAAVVNSRRKRAIAKGEKPPTYTADEVLRLHAKIRFLTEFGGRKKKLDEFGTKGVWIPKRKKILKEKDSKDIVKTAEGGEKKKQRLKRVKKKREVPDTPEERAERSDEEEEALQQEQEDYYGESLMRNKRNADRPGSNDYYDYYDYYGKACYYWCLYIPRSKFQPRRFYLAQFHYHIPGSRNISDNYYYYAYEEYYQEAAEFEDYIGDSLGIDMDTMDNYYDMSTYDLGFVDYSYLENITNDKSFDQLLKVSQTSDYSDVMDTLRPTREELRNYGHQGKDMMIQCSFDKNTCSFTDFKRINNAKYGNCYSFNVEQPGKFIKKTSRFGSQYGLRLTVNVESEEYVGMYAPETGIRVVIHPYDATPFPEDQGVSAPTGKATSIGIRKRRVSRLGTPWGECTNGNDPNIKLEYKGSYSVTGCMTSCVQSSLRDECGCVDLILSEKSTQERCSIANYTQVQCRARVYMLHSLNQLVCYCPDQCEEEWFETTISQSDWPSARYSPMMVARMNEFDYDSKLLDQLSPEYITKNFARVHIYFQELNFHQIVESPGYTGSRLLSDLGGTAGLYMGMSFLTVAEFFEMLLIVLQWMGKRMCFPVKKKGRVSPTP
ncbi:degenerin unc-8-like [Lineus longissimus]|uniref:degenerin unc-8-like n=1 Tax=Lineus longissimus TaxID=88925 RepID=UPI00315D8D3B